MHSAPWTALRQPCRGLKFDGQRGGAPTPGSLSCPPGRLLPEGLQGEWPEAQHHTDVHTTGPASHLVPTGGWAVGRGFGVLLWARGEESCGEEGRAPGWGWGRRGLNTLDWHLASWVWCLRSRQVRGEGCHADHKAARAAIRQRGWGSAERSAGSTCVWKMEPIGSADGGAGGGKGGEQREDTRFLA